MAKRIFTGEGILRHMFHGTYSAAVAISFDTTGDASAALATFGRAWKEGRDATTILWIGSDLELLKATLRAHGYKSIPCGRKSCRHGCKNAEVDNVNHSIDIGARFTVTFEVEAAIPAEQTALFGAKS